MKTGLTVSLVLLAAVIGCGLLSAQLTADVSRQYVSAAEEIKALILSGDWTRAEETTQGYMERWEETEKWLQILANHEDTDDVALSLKDLAAGIAAQDEASCLTACGELRENAQHIQHRDALTIGNIL